VAGNPLSAPSYQNILALISARKPKKVAMRKNSISPIMQSHASDANYLYRYTNIFFTPAAQELNICAIAQRYCGATGEIAEDGEPLPLQLSEDGQSVKELGPYSPGVEASDEKLAREVRDEFRRIPMPVNLRNDMVHASRDRCWLIAFRGLIIVQADQLEAELNEVKSFNDNLGTSSLARSAYARIRFSPVGSNHARLQLSGKISRALGIVSLFRAEQMKAAAEAGYDLGPIDEAELREAAMG
jgi:hypothetical protein